MIEPLMKEIRFLRQDNLKLKAKIEKLKNNK